MPCYHPLKAFKTFAGDIVFQESRRRNIVSSLTLSCGQCVGCRLRRSGQWAARCYHEASMYDNNCFITLTYSNESLPFNRSLDLVAFQKFMKRLRKRFGQGIRFFHCGEYGDLTLRPHYHACLFNFDFPDKYRWRKSPTGHYLYRSPALEELWPFGHSEIGTVTFESAAYVARYIMKKVNGDAAELHYSFIDPETGEIFDRLPEYVTMSRRPGIGHAWFLKYVDDVYPHDYVVIDGRKMLPPKYYDGQFELIDALAMDEIRFAREERAKDFACNTTPDRLRVRELVQLRRLENLPRTLE